MDDPATQANASPTPSLASPSSAPEGTVALAVPVASAYADPTILTAKPWNCLLEGELFASDPHRSGGSEEDLSHLRLPISPLPRGRARDPTGQESFDVEAA